MVPYQLNFRTDDRGIYRIFGVSAGRYKVAVGEGSETGAFFFAGTGRRPFSLTFHPGVSDVSKAAIVEVSEGSEVTDVNITVGRRIDVFTARGRVVNGETEQPLPNVRLALTTMMNDRSGPYLPVRAVTNSQGQFTLEGLPPGKYRVFIQPETTSTVYAEPAVFEVPDHDIKDVSIRTSLGASLFGTVALEGSAEKSVLAKLSQMQMHVYLRNERPEFTSWRHVAIRSDGTFWLGGLPPGTASVNMLSTPDRRAARDYVVLYIERDGIRQTQGIEIKAREEVTGLRVVVGYGTGAVRGSMKYENGPLPQGSRISVHLTRVGENTPLRSAQADDRGRFFIEGMPAGNYLLRISAYIPGRNHPPAVSQQLSVADGTVSEALVVVDLTPNPPKPRNNSES